jgi:hypothetical protein
MRFIKRIPISIFAILLFLAIVPTQGQKLQFEVPHYEPIKDSIQNSHSKYFYPTLLKRFELSDTTLSHEDLRYLYFGYIFQKEYEPNWNSKFLNILTPLYSKEKLTKMDCDTIIKYATLSVKEYPFDLRQLNMLSYAYHFIGDTTQALKCAYKTNAIISTILSTGNGMEMSTAWHVISVSHEYAILNAFQFKIKQQSLVGKYFDYLELQENPYNIAGFYFDVTKILETDLKK